MWSETDTWFVEVTNSNLLGLVRPFTEAEAVTVVIVNCFVSKHICVYWRKPPGNGFFVSCAGKVIWSNNKQINFRWPELCLRSHYGFFCRRLQGFARPPSWWGRTEASIPRDGNRSPKLWGGQDTNVNVPQISCLFCIYVCLWYSGIML